MEDLVDLNWLESELKKKNLYGISKIVSVEITPAVSDGENYASTLLRLNLKTVTSSGEDKFISMILKRNLDFTKFDSKDGSVTTTLDEAYTREYNFYVNIFPKIESFLHENEKLRPECVGSFNGKDLIFEDLRESGYSLANRLVGLNPDHCDLVFKCFGKFHAASYIAINEGLINVEEFRKYPIVDGTTGQKNKKSRVYEYVADVILKDWSQEWQEVGEKVENLKDTIKSEVERIAIVDDFRINVINHGDPWVNNFMFCYGSDGQPKSLKFLDFQMPHYNSFAFDLSYFLNTSVSGKNKQLHLDGWIETYCKYFKNILDLNKCQLPCPSTGMVKSELKRITPFSLNVCLRIRPIIMCKPEDSLPLAELIKDNGLTMEKRRIYANENLGDVLRIDLPVLFNEMDGSK